MQRFPWTCSPTNRLLAFCRVFRIGQTEETYITRFLVTNTIDERLEKMQDYKSEVIDEAMGDDGNKRPGK